MSCLTGSGPQGIWDLGSGIWELGFGGHGREYRYHKVPYSTHSVCRRHTRFYTALQLSPTYMLCIQQLTILPIATTPRIAPPTQPGSREEKIAHTKKNVTNKGKSGSCRRPSRTTQINEGRPCSSRGKSGIVCLQEKHMTLCAIVGGLVFGPRDHHGFRICYLLRHHAGRSRDTRTRGSLAHYPARSRWSRCFLWCGFVLAQLSQVSN